MATSINTSSELNICAFWIAMSFQISDIGRHACRKLFKQWDSIKPALRTTVVVRISYIPVQVYYVFSTYRATYYSDNALRADLNGACSSVLTAWLVCSVIYLHASVIITSNLADLFHHLVTVGLTLWYLTHSRAMGATSQIDTSFVRCAAVAGLCSLGICSIGLTLLFLLRTLSPSPKSTAAKRYASSLLTGILCITRMGEWSYHVCFMRERVEVAETTGQRVVVAAVVIAICGLCHLQWSWNLRCYKVQSRLWRVHYANLRLEKEIQQEDASKGTGTQAAGSMVEKEMQQPENPKGARAQIPSPTAESETQQLENSNGTISQAAVPTAVQTAEKEGWGALMIRLAPMLFTVGFAYCLLMLVRDELSGSVLAEQLARPARAVSFSS